MSSSFKGIIFALGACMVWGLIFVVPCFMQGFDAFETALGRHFVYGLISLPLLLVFWKKNNTLYPWTIWLRAFIFSLIANIIYYSCVVCGVRYSSPAITALILGVSPVIIAICGNWHEKQCSFWRLILPAILLLIGLVCVNWPAFQSENWHSSYFLGIFAACVATVAWCWYVVANALFLKKNTSLAPAEWSTLMGSATFIWVLVLGMGYEAWKGDGAWQRFVTPSSELNFFILGSLILGIVCSWVGAYLWNTASSNLPIALAGPLTIFETIFGVLFVYAMQQEIPPILEISGIILMLAAVAYSIHIFNTGKAEVLAYSS